MKPSKQKMFNLRKSSSSGMLWVVLITLSGGPVRAATWNVNADGNWSDAANWAGGVPDGAGVTASLTFNIYTALTPGPKTVTLDTTSRTVGILNIGDSGQAFLGYTLAASGGAALVLDNGLANAQINKPLDIGAAQDTISAPLLLNGSLDISDKAPAGLLISGGVTSNLPGTKLITNKGTGAFPLEISGVVGDGGGQIAVTQNSATSMLILSGANTYTGDTTVTAGTLQLGNGGSGGSISLASAIVNHGTLVFKRADTLTQGIDFNSVISGTGGITQAGAGTTMLNGANTFTGATTLTAGILSLGTISDGGTASDLGAATSAATNLVFNGGTLQYTGASATTNRNFSIVAAKVATFEVTANNLTISGASTATTGALSKTGLGTLTLAGANLYTGLTTVTAGTLAYGIDNALGAGAVTVNGGTLDLSTFNDSVGAVTLSSGTIAGAGGVLTSTAAFEMQGGTVSAILGGASALNKTTTGTLTLSGSNTYTGLTTISNGTLVYGIDNALGAGAVTVNGGVFDISTFSDTVGAVTLTSGAITGTTGVLSATSFALNNDGTTVSAILGGAGTLTANPGRYLVTTLTGANSYSGATTVSTGALNIQNALALGTDAAGTTVNTGASLQLQGGITVANEALTLKGTGDGNGVLRNISGNNIYGGLVTLGSTSVITSNADTLTLSNAGTITGATFGLTVNGAGNTTIHSIIGTTSGTLTKDGTGTLTLTGANTYTGATSVSAGVLNIQNNTALGTSAGGTSVAAGAALQLQGGITVGTEALTLSGTGISNDGALRSIGGTNIYGGLLTGLAGPIRINTDADSLTFSNLGSFTGSGVQLTVGGAGNTTIHSIIAPTNASTLTKDGAGTLTLSGLNTYVGLTTVSNGTLAYGVTNALSSGAVTVSGGVLDLSTFSDSVGTVTLINGSITGAGGTLTSTGAFEMQSGVVSAILGGSGALNKTTAGIVTLTAANTYTGLTTVSNGTLVYGGDNALGTGAVTVNGGVFALGTYSDSVGTVTLSSGAITGAGGVLTSTATFEMQSGAVSAVLGGGGALNKTTAGTVTLSGANTYTGLTTVTAGTLVYGGDNALGAGAVTVNGGILHLSTFSDTVGAVTLTSGSITGSGTLTSTSGFTINSTGPTSINAILAGSVGLTKTAAGTLTLTGANTYSGVTTLGGGVLAVSSIGDGGAAGNLGAAPALAANLVFDGGTLLFTGTTASTNRGFSINAGKVAIIDVSSAGGNLTVSGAGALTPTTGALTKTGAGTLTLAGSNTHTGLTTVAAGTLAYGANDVLAGAVTVSSGILDISTFSDTVGAVTLTSGSIIGSGTLTSTSGFIMNNADATSINAILAGTVGLTKSAVGTLTLTGANTYSGVTTLGNGTLSVGTIGNGGEASNLGAADASASRLVFDGGTLQYTGATAVTDRNFTINATKVAVIEVTSDISNLTLTGISMVSTGGLTKTGVGTLTLSGANSHTGLTTVAGGTLAYGMDNALSTGAVTVNGGILNLATFSDSVGAVTLTAGSIDGSGTLTSTSGFTINNAGPTSINAILAGSVGLTKSAVGTLTLAAANTYTGTTTIGAGILKLGTAGTTTHTPLGTTAAGTSVNSGATLDLNGFSLGTTEALTLNGIGMDGGGALANTSPAAATYSGLITLGSASRMSATAGDIVLSNTGTISGAYDMRLEGSAAGSSVASVIGIGAGVLYKSGTGTWTIAGANTYSGVTHIQGGTLKLGSAGGSTYGPLGTTAGATGTQIGAALDLNGFSLGTAEPLTLRGTGVSSGGALTNSAATAATYKGPLTMEAAVSIVASGGDIVLSSATAIAGSAVQLTVGGAKNTTIQSNYGPNTASTLSKVGAGTLTLTGVNTYAGATTVNEGTLSVGATGTINGTSGISIGTGVFNYNSTTALAKSLAFSGTGGTLSGSGTVTPAVTVTAGNTLAPGNSAGIMTFSGGLACAAASRLQWELNDNLTTGRGVVSDGVNVTGGAFSIAPGAIIDLKFGAAVDFSNPFWDTTRTWVLVDLGSGVLGDGGTEVFTLGTTYSGPEGSFTVTRIPGAGADTKNDVVLTWTAVTASPYESWAKTNITDRDPTADASPGGDPDHDGASNLSEFAFNGDPLNGADNGFFFGLTADTNGDSALELVLTVAVRKSAVFAAGSATSPVAEGIRYSIQGCYDLTGFSPSLVTPVDPAATILPGVPLTDPANYEFRSFSLNGSSGLPGKGFLRATVTQE